MSKRTMLHYWERLSQKDRRLIHDMLRFHGNDRRTLPMGLLPFVPVDEVLRLLRSNPASPWTSHLMGEYYGSDYRDRDYIDSDAKFKAYEKSRDHDFADYKRIIAILTEVPSKLAEKLQLWQERIAEGRE